MLRVLSNALLQDGRHVDVVVAGGVIVEVIPAGTFAATPALQGQVGPEIDDLGGRLLLPALAEPHAHLDKALLAQSVPNPTGDLMGAIDAMVAASAAGRFTYDDTVERAAAALQRLLVSGVTAVRTHVDVGDGVGVSNLLAVREARMRFEGLMDVQIAALMHSPMTGPEGAVNRSALADALEVGVEVIGGCPHLENDGPASIALAIEAATEAGIGIDMHTDETLDPSVRTLGELARQVQESGFGHPVSASHCVSLAMQAPDVQAEVIAQVAAAGISVIPNPQTNLFLQGRGHRVATPRGIAPITALRDAGVLVAAGADNVQDPFNPVGRSDPFETAALLVMAAHQLPQAAFDLVSNNARQVIGLTRVSMSPGDRADFVAIAAPSVRAAIADASRDRRVYRAGRLVATSTETSVVHR